MAGALDRSLEELIKVKESGSKGKGKKFPGGGNKGKGKKAKGARGAASSRAGGGGKNLTASRAAARARQAGGSTKKQKGAGKSGAGNNKKRKQLSAMKKLVQKTSLKQKATRAAKLKQALQSGRKTGSKSKKGAGKGNNGQHQMKPQKAATAMKKAKLVSAEEKMSMSLDGVMQLTRKPRNDANKAAGASKLAAKRLLAQRVAKRGNAAGSVKQGTSAGKNAKKQAANGGKTKRKVGAAEKGKNKKGSGKKNLVKKPAGASKKKGLKAVRKTAGAKDNGSAQNGGGKRKKVVLQKGQNYMRQWTAASKGGKDFWKGAKNSGKEMNYFKGAGKGKQDHFSKGGKENKGGKNSWNMYDKSGSWSSTDMNYYFAGPPPQPPQNYYYFAGQQKGGKMMNADDWSSASRNGKGSQQQHWGKQGKGDGGWGLSDNYEQESGHQLWGSYEGPYGGGKESKGMDGGWRNNSWGGGKKGGNAQLRGGKEGKDSWFGAGGGGNKAGNGNKGGYNSLHDDPERDVRATDAYDRNRSYGNKAHLPNSVAKYKGTGKMIQIANCPPNLNKEELQGAFGDLGTVLAVELDKTANLAWLVFDNSRDAYEAEHQFDGGEINGSTIKITMS